VQVGEPTPKRLVWVASSRRDLRAMPPAVRRAFGLALFAAQCGETPPIAKPMRGFGGAGVLELLEDDRGGTYRAVYSVRFASAVYVLHAFQKKSKRGRATPQQEIDMIRNRLRQAEAIHAEQDDE
jgi:phage-related protein